MLIYRPKPNELLDAAALAADPEKPPNGNPPPNDDEEACAFAAEPEKPPPPKCGYPDNNFILRLEYF